MPIKKTKKKSTKIYRNISKKIKQQIRKASSKSLERLNLSKKDINRIVDDFVTNFFSPKTSKSSLLEKQERYAAYNLGKGYGVSSIKEEVNNCIKLLGVKPYIFIDIGANIGEYSKEVLNRFPDIEVYMFEPSNFHRTNLTNLFGFLPNVNINNIALSNKSGETVLYSDKYGSPLSSLTERNLEHLDINFKYKENIISQRFDEFWKKIKNNNRIIDYVKIDVEGNELLVLEGFGELINKTRLIQFEFGGSNIDTRTYFKDFWLYFMKHNFSIYRISPIGLLFISKYWEMDEIFLTTNYIAVNKNNI